jgi:hypothetical protein
MNKDPIQKAADAIDKAGKNVKDSFNEARHRGEADAERASRETLGDEMTTSEKVGSVVNEAKNRTQAEIDAAKRELRNKT